MARRPGWPYKDDFRCHRCGNCCRGDGYVELTDSDIDRAADYLSMVREDFLRDYCLEYADEIRLKDQQDEEQSCIFLTEENGLFGCRIHEAKPSQCAGFPFKWRPRGAVKFCEGLRALEGLPPLEGSSTMTPGKGTVRSR